MKEKTEKEKIPIEELVKAAVSDAAREKSGALLDILEKRAVSVSEEGQDSQEL